MNKSNFTSAEFVFNICHKTVLRHSRLSDWFNQQVRHFHLVENKDYYKERDNKHFNYYYTYDVEEKVFNYYDNMYHFSEELPKPHKPIMKEEKKKVSMVPLRQLIDALDADADFLIRSYLTAYSLDKYVCRLSDEELREDYQIAISSDDEDEDETYQLVDLDKVDMYQFNTIPLEFVFHVSKEGAVKVMEQMEYDDYDFSTKDFERFNKLFDKLI